MKSTNRWYDAVLEQLRLASGEPRTADQIWAAMEAGGFQHASQNPRATLGARLAELAHMGKIERTARATYRDARTATERFRAGEGVPIEDFIKQGSFPRLAPKGAS